MGEQMISDGNRPIVVRTARRLTIPTLLLAILFQGLSPQNALGNGIDWTARTSAADNNWYGVAFGNNLFVAVGASGTGNRVMTSPDGITWTARTSAANSDWTSVTYGNGLFVAVAYSGAGNRVMTSPDGITWTGRTAAANNQWSDVTYGNGLFVAVSDSGSGNRVMTSPDGINWTTQSTPANNGWFGITYGNGLFVAVAYSGAGNRVMTSSNGTSWTTRSTPVDNSWVSVTYGNGLFVAVAETGTGNRVMTSPDGVSWTTRSTPADNSWQGVTYGNGLFVAVAKTGTGNRVMTSPDGVNWTIRSNPVNNDWQSVTYGYGSFVAVGITGTGNRVMSTPLSTMPSSGNLVDLRANRSASYPGSGNSWFDLSGNNRTATLQSTPTWSNSLSGIFTLDGTDHFSLGSGFDSFTAGLSISVYANFGSHSSTRTWERLMDFGNADASDNILFARFDTSNDLTFEIYRGAISQGHCRATNGLLENTWATYAVTINGSTCKLYRDGVEIHSTSYTGLPVNITRNNNYIGRSNWAADAYFDTGISAFAMWNRSLSASEISTASSVQKGTTAPTVTSVSSNTSNGSYKTGDAIDIRITFSETVTVTGTPQITLETGSTDRAVNYSSGSGSTVLIFNYTVQAGDTSSDLDYVATNSLGLNGGTISDAAGNNATLTLPAPGAANSLGANKLLVIDGIAPTFTSSSSFSVAENIATSATAATIRVSESATVTISSGADAARFNIARSETDTAIIKFNASPDFEAPVDVGGNNVYEITLTATDAASNTGTQSITITVTDVVDTSSFNSLALAGGATTAIYRTVVVITANVSVASRVTFRVNGKVLPGCKNRLASGSGSNFSVTCSWRPSNRGTVSLTAAATPTGAGISSTTAIPVSIMVGKRAGSR